MSHKKISFKGKKKNPFDKIRQTLIKRTNYSLNIELLKILINYKWYSVILVEIDLGIWL